MNRRRFLSTSLCWLDSGAWVAQLRMRVSDVTLAVSVTLLLFVAALDAEGQRQVPKVPRIGVLEANRNFEDPFKEGLGHFGYVDGKNIDVEWRWSHGRAELFPELAAELVRLKVDVIVATNNPAVAAAKKATKTIPIVMVIATDPVRLGFVASLARPGGNITGLTIQASDIAGKRLQLLKAAVPELTRVAVLWDASEPGRRELVMDTEVAASKLGLQLHMSGVRSPADIDRAFTAMRSDGVGAVLVYGSSMLYAHRITVAKLAAKHRLPTMCPGPEWMDAGFVMTYSPSLNDMYRRAPYFVDKLLKGATPADLPVEQPTKFALVISTKIAKTVGVAIPASLAHAASQPTAVVQQRPDAVVQRLRQRLDALGWRLPGRR
jgi:putative tryptophan/tyrosine transport system substrate-binding protein